MSEPIVLLRNRRAFYEFAIIDTIECGIVLNGDEVKAVRAKEAQFTDAFVRVKDGQLYVHNMFISAYRQRDITSSHEGLRVRKLLAHKREIAKMNRHVIQKGHALVPIDIHLTARGRIKLAIAIATGKKTTDKREVIRSRDLDREAAREVKQIHDGKR